MLQALHHIQRSVRGIPNLPAFVLHHDLRSGRISWWELIEDVRRLRPFDFEFLFHVEQRRDEYHARNLAAIRRSGRQHIGTLFGFSDLYVPLAVAPSYTLAFTAGQWAARMPTADWLVALWRELSGHLPSSADPRFHRFVRCCLDVPVLDGTASRPAAALRGLIELAKLLRELVGGRAPETVAGEVARVRRQILSPSMENHGWLGSCLDVDGVIRPPWGLDEFPDERLVDELGLDTRPSVLGILVRDVGEPAGAPGFVEEQLRRKAFQHAALRAVRAMDSCIAAPLGELSVVVALGSRLGRDRAELRARPAEVRSRFRQLEGELRRQGHPCTGALGVELAPGQPLGASFRSAVAAIATKLAGRGAPARSAVAHELPLGQLVSARCSTVQAFELHRPTEVRASLTRFIALTRAVTGGSSEAMMVHFHLLLHDLLGVLERRSILTSVRRRTLQGTMCEPWFLAAPADAVRGLERHVEDLLALLSSSGTADRQARMQEAAVWLEEHLAVGDALGETARRAGLAVSSFRREFRRSHGRSFGAWLRERRLEEAARILRLSPLNLRDIRLQVGIPDEHTFIRCFRRHFGTTPSRYRARAEPAE